MWRRENWQAQAYRKPEMMSQRHQSCDVLRRSPLALTNTITSARIQKEDIDLSYLNNDWGFQLHYCISGVSVLSHFSRCHGRCRVDRWLFTSSNDCRLTKLDLRESKRWLPSRYAIMFSYNLASVIKVLCKHARCIWACCYLGEVAFANRVHRYIW